MQPELDPLVISEIQSTCAIRFNGYEYTEATRQEFPDIIKQIKEDLRMHEDPLKNFAAFFALQRFLCKWGGEQLSEESPDRIAYNFLYLHLYRLETPKEYVHAGSEGMWSEVTVDDREVAAAHIRSRFSCALLYNNANHLPEP